MTKNALRRSQSFLKNLCDGVAAHMIIDPRDPWHGGVRCYLDLVVETRGAEACYAMAYLYRQSGEEKYLTWATAMVEFLLRSQAPNGWWIDEGSSTWRGTTVFKAMALEETYFLLKDQQAGLCKRIQSCLDKAINFLSKALTKEALNINYRLTLAPVLWMASEILGRQELTNKAASCTDLLLSHINEDGLIFGEGDGRVASRFIQPVDIGYNVGMSLGAITIYALETNNNRLLERILESAKAHLFFVYPDGSLDNSWGSRSYKWTLLDSKTVHGAAMAYLLLSHLNPSFLSALSRHLDYLETLMRDGECATGPHFYKNPDYVHPCMQMTLFHACGLASGLIHTRLSDAPDFDKGSLPCDDTPWSRKFHSVNVVLHRSKNIMATVAGTGHSRFSDRFFPTIPSGGNISYLWGAGFGPIQVGSQYNYERIEAGNMPESFDKPGNLTPRIDYYATKGNFFSSALERNTVVTVEKELFSVCCGRLRNLAGQDGGIGYKIAYAFRDSGLRKSFTLEGPFEGWILIQEPVVFDPELFSIERTHNGLNVLGPRAKLRLTFSHPIICNGSDRNALLWCPFPSVYCLDLKMRYIGEPAWVDIELA